MPLCFQKPRRRPQLSRARRRLGRASYLTEPNTAAPPILWAYKPRRQVTIETRTSLSVGVLSRSIPRPMAADLLCHRSHNQTAVVTALLQLRHLEPVLASPSRCSLLPPSSANRPCHLSCPNRCCKEAKQKREMVEGRKERNQRR
jgi:hypothetical protein